MLLELLVLGLLIRHSLELVQVLGRRVNRVEDQGALVIEHLDTLVVLHQKDVFLRK